VTRLDTDPETLAPRLSDLDEPRSGAVFLPRCRSECQQSGTHGGLISRMSRWLSCHRSLLTRRCPAQEVWRRHSRRGSCSCSCCCVSRGCT
jgi:hypothetical protein